MNTPAVRVDDEITQMALKMRALNAQIRKMDLALSNCRALAARHRAEEWAQQVLRFCADAGIKPNLVRSDPDHD